MIAAILTAALLHLSPGPAGEKSEPKPRRAVSAPGEGVLWSLTAAAPSPAVLMLDASARRPLPHKAGGEVKTFILHLQPEAVAASVSVQPDKIDLGETATLTLAIEGAAPLRVEVPAEAEKLLTAKSALMWQIKPLGPARTMIQDTGRERWEQSFRLSPFYHGDRVALAFNSVLVNGQPVTFDAQVIRVRKTIDDASAEKAVPITGIEELPAIPPTPPDASGWPFVAGLAIVFAAAIAFALIRKKRTTVPPMPANAWAERELDRLERDRAMERIDTRATIDRLAAIVREYVERRFAVPASTLTTAELLATDWPAERSEPLRDMLETCDRAKFAGESPDAFALLSAARAWIAAATPLDTFST